MNECFPSQVRAITSSSIVCVARFISLVIPYVPKFLLLTGVPYSIFFVFVASLGIIASFLLRETLGENPTEMVQELNLEGVSVLKPR